MKILVPVDGSDSTERAISLLTERPWRLDDQFLVLCVVEPVPLEYPVGYFPPSYPTDSETRVYEESAKISGNAGAKIQTNLPKNSVQVKVLDGLAAETICKCAYEWNADLIIMGSHGRKGMSHFLLGSVAEEVLKNAPCSVEIVKAKRAIVEEKQGEERSKRSKSKKTSKVPQKSAV